MLVLVTSSIGWIAGGLPQPSSYSVANDDLGLWEALSPDLLGRLGAAALVDVGVGGFLDGLFRLDCRGIDAACTNDSWHAHAHKVESGISAAAIFLAPLVCASRSAGSRAGGTPGSRRGPYQLV